MTDRRKHKSKQKLLPILQVSKLLNNPDINKPYNKCAGRNTKKTSIEFLRLKISKMYKGATAYTAKIGEQMAA